MMTTAVQRTRCWYVALAVGVLSLPLCGCATSKEQIDEARMQEFLTRHRQRDWIKLTPDKIQELADLKQHIDDARRSRERAREGDRVMSEQLDYAEPIGPPITGMESEAAPPAGASGPNAEGIGPPVEADQEPARAATKGDAVKGALDFRDVPLKDVVRMVARSEGLDVLVPESLDQKVTLSLHNTNPMVMLASILEQNEMVLAQKPSGLWVVEPIKQETAKPKDDVVVRTFTLNSIPVATIEEPLRKLVSQDGKLVVNSNGTSFLMMDHAENVKMMEDYVSLLDVKERQVLVEARIIEARLETDDELGVLLQALGADIENVTLAAVQDLTPTNKAVAVGLAYGREPISGVLSAIASRRLVNILSAPKVATVNGKKAVMEVIEKIPYVQSTATTSTSADGLGSTTVQQVAFEEVGVTLTVTPTVGGDNTIKMEIVPEVKALTSFFNGVPVVDRRKVNTNIMVRDGETVLIGGILREDEIDAEVKTPLLGDIPLLGFLFTKNERRREKSELIVMITPTILHTTDPENGEKGKGGQQRDDGQ